MQEMKAGRIFAAGDVRVVTEHKPETQPGDTLVQVTAVGLCGSDLHWFHGGGIGDAQLEQPLVLGHEFAGVAVDGPLAGQLVAVDPARPCYDCVDCHAGKHNLCINVAFAGHGKNDGGLRQYVSWPTKLLFPIPSGMTAAEAALLEPLGVALHAWDLGKARLADNIAIVGAGPIGLCLVRLARAAGMSTITVVEPLAHRRQAALDAGATAVFDPADAELATQVAGHTTQGLVDLAFEISNSPAGIGIAIDLIRPGARVVLAGIPDNNVTTFDAAAARRKGLNIKISRRMGDVYPRAITLVDRGIVEVSSLVTHEFPLDDLALAFQQAHERVGLKVIVNPNA